MAEADRIAAALAYQGATAAPPTMAQELAKVPSRLIGALKALGTGSSYGSAEPVNAVNDLARTKFWRGSVFGVPEDVQQRNQARAMEAVSMAAPIVYHGSPHRFAPTAKNPLGEFDPSKIGTGEGAQAYGYGHYLAESPNTASEYIRAGRNLGFENRDDAARLGEKAYAQAKGNKEEALKILDDLAASTKSANRQNNVFFAKKMIQEGTQKSSLYKVDLPDEVVPRMLDYDKPIKDQPEILNALRSRLPQDMLKAFDTNVESGISGANAYKNWLWDAGKTDASRAETLRQMGISGIQFLDAGSRGAGTGTRNFVVFPGNEGLLNILGRE